MSFFRFLGHVAAATVVRRVVGLLFVVALSYCAMSAVRAQAWECSVSTSNCSQADAYSECRARITQYKGTQTEPTLINGEEICAPGTHPALPSPAGRYSAQIRRTTGLLTAVPAPSNFFFAFQCPAGQPWNESTKTCGDQCADAPDLGPSAILSNDVTGKKCALHGSALCEYETADDGGSGGWAGVKSIVIGTGQNRTLFSKSWVPTGQECAAPTPAKPYDPTKPVCNAIGGNGARECIDPNGRHCVIFSSGLKTCWESSLGQEGGRQSSDGTEGADRSSGNPPAPNEPPENMANPSPVGPPGNTIINNITNNTQLYTGTGTNGPGQPNTGTGGNDPGAGDGEGDGEGDDEGQGTASGGGDCGAAPVCSMVDGIGCAILQQQWRTRCASEGNAGDFGGVSNDIDGELSVLPGPTELGNDDSIDSSFLNGGQGWAGRGQCPIDVGFDIGLGSFTANPDNLCALLNAIAGLVLLAGYAAAGVILLGGVKTV